MKKLSKRALGVIAVCLTLMLGDDDTMSLQFDEPHRAVTPGQLVALFDRHGIEVIGAATIREVT